MSRGVRVSVEWARFGKGDGDSLRVLECSRGGDFSAREFAAVFDRFHAGTPSVLPQVTIAWAGKGQEARVVLVIHEESDRPDSVGRVGVDARMFAVRYADLARGPVSYGDLYEAFFGLILPYGGGPIEVELPVLDPGPVADRLTEEAMSTAALLLAGRAVCVLGGDDLPLRLRLRYLDDVAALLPYGMRARLSAATWTSSTARHRIRLSFGQAEQDAAWNVIWERLALIPYEAETARKYLELLASYERRGALVATLAAATEPLDFSQAEAALAALDGTARAPVGAPTSTTENFVRGLLERCVEALEQRDGEKLSEQVTELKSFVEVPHTDRQRDGYRRFMKDANLLGEVWGVSERVRAEFYEVLLALAFGARLTETAVEEIRDLAGGRLHGSLVPVMTKFSRTRGYTFRLDDGLTSEELGAALAQMPVHDVVELAAAEETGKDLFLAAIASLRRRVAAGPRPGDRSGTRLAEALRRHGHLIGPVLIHFPDDPQSQYRVFADLLRMAYGSGLGPSELEAVLTDGAEKPSSSLLAAALAGSSGNDLAFASRLFLAKVIERQLPPGDAVRLLLARLTAPAPAPEVPDLGEPDDMETGGGAAFVVLLLSGWLVAGILVLILVFG